MDLRSFISQDKVVLAIAERVRLKYSPLTTSSELIASFLAKSLKKYGIDAKHVIGTFMLDEPDAEQHVGSGEWDELDEYSAKHDWVEIGGKILDISASKYEKSVYDSLPRIVYVNQKSPLSTRYKTIKYHGTN
jgi:hypothetical protein